MVIWTIRRTLDGQVFPDQADRHVRHDQDRGERNAHDQRRSQGIGDGQRRTDAQHVQGDRILRNQRFDQCVFRRSSQFTIALLDRSSSRKLR